MEIIEIKIITISLFYRFINSEIRWEETKRMTKFINATFSIGFFNIPKVLILFRFWFRFCRLGIAAEVCQRRFKASGNEVRVGTSTNTWYLNVSQCPSKEFGKYLPTGSERDLFAEPFFRVENFLFHPLVYCTLTNVDKSSRLLTYRNSMGTHGRGRKGPFDDNLLKSGKYIEWTKKSFWLSWSGERSMHRSFGEISMPLGMLFRSSGQWNLIHIVLLYIDVDIK